MGMIHLSSLFKSKPGRIYQIMYGRTDICHLIPFVLRNPQKAPTNMFSMVSIWVGEQTSLLTHYKGKQQHGKLILLFTEAGRIRDAAVLDCFLSPVWQASEGEPDVKPLIGQHPGWLFLSNESPSLTGYFYRRTNVQTYRKVL